MKKNILFILLTGILATGCNDWMDLKPENGRLSESYWQKEEDVHNTMMSCYVRFRDCLEKMVQWGEVRADAVQVKNNVDADLIKQQNITSENPIVKWNPFYSMINSANALIKYAPLVIDRDPLFTQEKLDRYLAEAKFVRSLGYFYLVRSFREVPLILEPYITDEQKIAQPKVSERVILDQLMTDLKWCIKFLPENYAGANTPQTWQNKGRATRWAAMALLADIYLWDERYTDCIGICEKLMNENRFKLMEDKSGFFQNFLQGLTAESIFEFYYSADLKQESPLFGWFKPADGRFFLTLQTTEEYKTSGTEVDIRGENVSWRNESGNCFIWKYVGAAVATSTSSPRRDKHDANWIVYRLAEIYLIHAEACLMEKGYDRKNYSKAISSINKIRTRAQIALLGEIDAENFSEEQLLLLIMAERKKEFLGEGKRWYDMVRLAKKSDFSKYKKLIVSVLLENVSILERPLYEMRLSKDWNFYFPIHKNEIDLGKGLLEQNPVYQ